MTAPLDDPRADEGLVEVMARAIRDTQCRDNGLPYLPVEWYYSEAEAALAAARSHGGM